MLKNLFQLDSNITFLNHGSFGACPKFIFNEYQNFQAELEKDPVNFIQVKAPDYLNNAKKSLANYINASENDFVFTPNPTFAINTILHSLKLNPGDEILSTNHEYGAMDRSFNFYCKKTGAKYIRQNINLPIQSVEQILDQFWKGYTNKTKVIFINQYSSSTAIIFPVEQIIQKAKSLGLITIIDGAHVPGHIPLNLNTLNPDFYAGTLHKWMLAPKGSSFLYVSKKFQNQLDPLVVSWGYESLFPSESQFLDYHEYQGTQDISQYLCTPTVINFLQQNNWEKVSQNCKKMVLENYENFCNLLNTKPICPVSNQFLGQMASIPIQTQKPYELKAILIEKHKIQVPIMPLNGNWYLRYSINGYNTQADLDILFQALHQLKKEAIYLE